MKRALLGALLALCIVGSAAAQYAGISYTLSTTSSVYVTAGHTWTYVMVDNPNASIAVACAFGQPAALNVGGSYMLQAGTTRIWPAFAGGPMPTGNINCIAASGSPTITIAAY